MCVWVWVCVWVCVCVGVGVGVCVGVCVGVSSHSCTWHNLPGIASQFGTQNPGFAMHCCNCLAKDV